MRVQRESSNESMFAMTGPVSFSTSTAALRFNESVVKIGVALTPAVNRMERWRLILAGVMGKERPVMSNVFLVFTGCKANSTLWTMSGLPNSGTDRSITMLSRRFQVRSVWKVTISTSVPKARPAASSCQRRTGRPIRSGFFGVHRRIHSSPKSPQQLPRGRHQAQSPRPSGILISTFYQRQTRAKRYPHDFARGRNVLPDHLLVEVGSDPPAVAKVSGVLI